MTKKKEKQLLCEDNLRHNEYYGMQSTIDNLYQASANGEVFTDLMSVILQRENILLAYRNIKKNTGSKTSGTDNLTIEDIGKCTPDEVVEKVRFIVNGSKHGYRPKPVRRKEIPKPYDPSKTRPLGIPCIWDRLVQQCIKQVMEPVCEAKFSNNSYGFRPNHSVENAIARSYQLLQHANLHYVIEFDIKGFFDNVNHAKLIRQIWAMGIHDKKWKQQSQKQPLQRFRVHKGEPFCGCSGQAQLLGRFLSKSIVLVGGNADHTGQLVFIFQKQDRRCRALLQDCP